MKTERPVAISLFVLVSLIQTGCSGINVKKTYSLDGTSGAGVLVASLTQSGVPSRYGTHFSIRGVDNSYKGTIAIFDVLASADWRCPMFGSSTEDAPCGRLAIVELPQGEYEFYSWGGAEGFGNRVEAEQEFSKRFRITAGKATYVGNVHLSAHRGSFDIKVLDRQKRDLDLLYQRAPTITADQVLIDIIQ